MFVLEVLISKTAAFLLILLSQWICWWNLHLQILLDDCNSEYRKSCEQHSCNGKEFCNLVFCLL